MIHIDIEQPHEIAAREALLDRAFGPARFAKTCERLREGRAPADGLSFIARANGSPVGTLRFWHIDAGGVEALMLGPLAVEESHRALGIGGTLIRVGLSEVKTRGHRAILLVGDAPYYQRFGFSREAVARLAMPGPVNIERFLGLALVDGALEGACGLVQATGRLVSPREVSEGRRLAA